jgi:putative membrane-bound dehydrogenase-like protein
MRQLTLLTLAMLLLAAGSTLTHRQITQSQRGELPLLLPDDLEATLWAESPMLYNPTNLDVDARGRIWVTEAVNYRTYSNADSVYFHHQKGDRVVILEDSDQDGKADKSTVFVQDTDLVAPLGIAVIGNRVVVSCSPNLLIFTDTDGDDRADKKEVLLTGFGGLDHDHSLHSVVVGSDGKWYFNVGNAGPHKVTDRGGWSLRSGSAYTGGSPYNDKNEGRQVSDDGRVWVGGLQMRMNPDGTGLEVLAHGFRNSYETYVDSFGDLWQNDNDDQVVACRTSWIMEGGNAGFFNPDGTRMWQADQRPGQDMFTAHWHQQDPGMMPAGDCTGAGSPTGVAMHEGDQLGAQYRGLLLSADAGRNVIFGYHPQPTGAGFDLGKRSNFITSTPEDDKGYFWNDENHQKDQAKWFRPSDVAIGTDGALYIADWYDPVVGGHLMRDSTGYGRIYRIAPKGKKLTNPVIDLKHTAGQLEALKSPAVNVRAQGMAALQVQGKAVLPAIEPLLNDANPYVQARALALQYKILGKEALDLTIKKPASPAETRLAVTALRCLRQVVPAEQLLPLANKMADWWQPMLLRECAHLLRDLPFEQKKNVLGKISRSNTNDPWLLNALYQALNSDQERKMAFETIPLSGINPNVLLRLAWLLHTPECRQILEKGVDTSPSPDMVQMSITGIAFMNDTNAVHTMLRLADSPRKEVAEQARYWLAFRKTNEWANLIEWKKTGLDLAREQKMAELKAKRTRMLNEHVADWDRKSTAKDMALDSLGGQMLIAMAAQKEIPADLLETVSANIVNNPDLSVRLQAGNHFQRPGSGKTWSIEKIGAMKGKPGKGQKVYAAKCGTCHKFGEMGANIAPELTQIKGKYDKTALLDAIVNPSAGLVFGYEAWLITLKDNDSAFGFLQADGEQVVIKELSGQTRAIVANNIAKREKQVQSVMPAPDMLGMSEQDLANLLAFLMK